MPLGKALIIICDDNGAGKYESFKLLFMNVSKEILRKYVELMITCYEKRIKGLYAPHKDWKFKKAKLGPPLQV